MSSQGATEPARPGHAPTDPRRDVVVMVVLLVALNLCSALILSGLAQAAVQVGVAVLAVVAALRLGYDQASLGLRPADIPAGLRLGGLVSLGIVAAVTVVALVPVTRGAFDDERFVDLSTADAVFEIAVRIPLVTALSEELLFRSVLLAVLVAASTTWRAVAASSLLFGLWHVATTLGDLGGNEVTEGFAAWEAAGAVLVVVAVTGAGGLVFCWLRLRSASVVAPWLVHTTLNAATFTAGAIAA